MVTRFPLIWRWETLALAWLTLVIVTTLHEFAHGLTCKHFGGEVHELGFLLMFFIPCFYCNVSDAWLFREKSKRLWVTLAGGYCDLLLWAVAIFAWRLTLQDTLVNYLAWVAISVLGVRVFFMREIKRRGLAAVMKQAVAIARGNGSPYGVSLDLDALDPRDAPGVGLPVTGGIRATDLLRSLSGLARDAALAGVEIAEYNPYRDRRGVTARVVGDVILSVLRGR